MTAPNTRFTLRDALAAAVDGWWEAALAVVAIAALVVLTCCGESASCWNDIKGRYTSCEDMRRDEIDKRIDERERQR